MKRFLLGLFLLSLLAVSAWVFFSGQSLIGLRLSERPPDRICPKDYDPDWNGRAKNCRSVVRFDELVFKHWGPGYGAPHQYYFTISGDGQVSYRDGEERWTLSNDKLLELVAEINKSRFLCTPNQFDERYASCNTMPGCDPEPEIVLLSISMAGQNHEVKHYPYCQGGPKALDALEASIERISGLEDHGFDSIAKLRQDRGERVERALKYQRLHTPPAVAPQSKGAQ